MRNEKWHLSIQTHVHFAGLFIVLFIAFVVSSCFMGASRVFADDEGVAIQEAESGTSIVVSIICGEHGKVEGKTGDFTEMVTSGSDLKLILAADQGYLIGNVLINDEPLAASDLIGIAGKTNSQLDLEDLEDSLSVKIIFMTAEDYENQIPIPGPTDSAAGGASSGNDSWQSDEGTSADGTGEADPTMQGGGSGIITDTDTADGFGGESVDGENSSDNTEDDEDEDGFEPDDDWGAEDDAEDLAMLASAESDDTSAGNDYAAAESDAAAIDLDNSISSDGIVKSVGTAASTTRGDNTSDTDKDDDYEDGSDGKGDYDENDDYDTPKTGDESIFSAATLLIVGITLLCIAIVIAVRGEDLRTGGGHE